MVAPGLWYHRPSASNTITHLYWLCNPYFADDVNLMTRTEAEFNDVTTRLEIVSKLYWIKISIEKTKILLNSLKEYCGGDGDVRWSSIILVAC